MSTIDKAELRRLAEATKARKAGSWYLRDWLFQALRTARQWCIPCGSDITSNGVKALHCAPGCRVRLENENGVRDMNTIMSEQVEKLEQSRLKDRQRIAELETTVAELRARSIS